MLPREPELTGAVHEIYRWLRAGYRVVAVASAIGDTTDHLLERARAWDAPALPTEHAPVGALLATGEAQAVALLALALGRAGIPATPFDAARAGLRTTGSPSCADPVALDTGAVRRVLEQGRVAVLPGFVGVHDDGSTALLGRGGSDLSALFVAHQLRAARVRLVKDVRGVYTGDPATRPDAVRLATVTWDDALAHAGPVVQARAVTWARDRRVTFEVGALAHDDATVVGPGPTRIAPPASHTPVLRVALLGLGTVGRGVLAHLRAQPERFRIIGACARNPARHAGLDVPVTSDPDTLLDLRPDVLVEAIPGFRPAAATAARALRHGIHVVTANKRVVAGAGARLGALARATGASLRFAAAVGGAAPVLESVRRARRAGPIASIEGTLNGTSGFVLDRVRAGAPLNDAVREAQRLGLAEADPADDLDGLDAARKLVILAREAFDARLRAGPIPRQPITGLRPGADVRQVASVRTTPDGLQAQVELRAASPDDPLAATRGPECRVIVRHADGTTTLVTGIGAGRWPTAESVTADLLDLWRDTAAHATTASRSPDPQETAA